MKRIISLIVFSLLLGAMSACNQEQTPADTNADSEQTTAEPLAVGTAIKDVTETSTTEPAAEKGKTLTWEDLIPKDFEPELILDKYAEQINNVTEGSVEEKALLDEVIAEFNNIPSNEALNDVYVRIPGFVAPLDEKDGMVGEFLLVPYFGSCIHSPPPPVNQTVLVLPQKSKSIAMEDIDKPVWVTGRMLVERKDTDLAKAGYVIQDATLEFY